MDSFDMAASEAARQEAERNAQAETASSGAMGIVDAAAEAVGELAVTAAGYAIEGLAACVGSIFDGL